MLIVSDTYYVGIADEKVRLFEGQYDVPEGMRYNSYLILDEKIAVTDTVDAPYADKWLDNIEKTLAGKMPDYLIISHMEPDHSSCINKFVEKYPTATLVGNAKTFVILNAFFEGLTYNALTVENGGTLSLGKHELTFVFAPMVHWPEVMVYYDGYTKTLFSADAFGKFGATGETSDWACEARRYYFGIVGKYGVQVQTLLSKLTPYPIETICPLHGPVLSENLAYYLGLYNTWSKYEPETKGVTIAYTSVYGNTKKAALDLADKLKERGVKTQVFDLTRDDIAEAVESAFELDTLVLASTTYNGDVFPKMKEFILALTERNYQSRRVAFIENGSWAPMAKKVMLGMFEKSKNIEFIDSSCTIKSGYKSENAVEIEKMAQQLA